MGRILNEKVNKKMKYKSIIFYARQVKNPKNDYNLIVRHKDNFLYFKIRTELSDQYMEISLFDESVRRGETLLNSMDLLP